MKYLKKILKNNYIKIFIAEILLLVFSTIILSYNLKARQKSSNVMKKNIALVKKDNENEDEQEKDKQEEYEQEETNREEEPKEDEEKLKNNKGNLKIISSYISRMTSDREKEKNRVHNIKKAAEYVNNIELKPGEEFSFYEAVWAKNKNKC